MYREELMIRLSDLQHRLDSAKQAVEYDLPNCAALALFSVALIANDIRRDIDAVPVAAGSKED